MEMTDFFAVILSPWAQAKFGHTIAAGYMTGALFVLAISAYYLLKGRDIDFAKRSLRIAAAFGLDTKKLLSSVYYRLTPDTENPYHRMYTNN